MNDKGTGISGPFLKEVSEWNIPVVKQIAKAIRSGMGESKMECHGMRAKDSLGISMEVLDDAVARLLRLLPL